MKHTEENNIMSETTIISHLLTKAIMRLAKNDLDGCEKNILEARHKVYKLIVSKHNAKLGSEVLTTQTPAEARENHDP